MRKIKIAFSCLAIATSLNGLAADWSYSGATGPDYWGSLSEEFATCATGIEQSPIDLGRFAREDDDLESLEHRFSSTPLTVVNNGHTIQVNINENSYTTTEYGKQRLLQFHFHSPSENTINGKQYPLEAHFVHINNEGTLSVVGVMYDLGKANKTIGQILAIAPDHKGTASNISKRIDPNSVMGTNETEDYFRFAGSLTTPPCTEGVRWYVSQDVKKISQDQLDRFEHLFHGGNARPVQNLNYRRVKTTDD